MRLAISLCSLLSVAYATDRTDLENHVEGVEDSAPTFNKGSKLGGVLARELARLSERITKDCEDNLLYRPVDGVCSNLNNPGWGAPLQTMKRLIEPKYHDGKGSPRMFGKSNKVLPSARKVSVECFKEDSEKTEDKPFSQMVMQWGQFVDHDITGTPGTGVGDCCAEMGKNGIHPDFHKDGPCLPIQIPKGDRQFTNCMEFSRSLPVVQVTENCPREQINVLTPYLDGGMVYGSSMEEMDDLRTGSEGLMRTSDDNLLPTSDNNFCIKRNAHSCFNAGDFRVNVFPGLTAMHTLFVREHNRLAKELAKINPGWEDEKLFQEARKIVIAELQHITYNYYLRETLGPAVYKLYKFSEDFEYDDSLNPGIFNSFATAAFRHGHSQIAGHYGVKGDAKKPIEDLYMDISYVEDSIDDVILGVTDTPNQKADSRFPPGVSDHLFENTSKPGVSLDLISLNIQRGRDHGLATYMDFVIKWSEVLSKKKYLVSKPTMPLCAIGLYENLYEIDLYVGAMDEKPLKDAMVGPTFAYIIAEQFKNIRNGDRFWYEAKNSTTGFTTDQRNEIRKMTLAHVICDNTGIAEIQPDVFKLPDAPGNNKVSCSTILSSTIDLDIWKE